MTGSSPLVTPTDRALLRALATEPTVVAACRRIGVTRDVGVYRLRRLARTAGGPVVRSDRGGRFGGGSHLTARGRALLRSAVDAVAVRGPPWPPPEAITALKGSYRSRPEPTVVLAGGFELVVTFRAREGESIRVGIDPDSVLVATRPFASSARNRLRGRVAAIRPSGPRVRTVSIAVGPHRFRASLTERSVRTLGLRVGAPVVLLIKATALRRLPQPGD